MQITHGQSIFAVFDGHGGTEAAYYAAAQLICELKSCSNLVSSPGEALKKAVMQVDKNFVAKATQEVKYYLLYINEPLFHNMHMLWATRHDAFSKNLSFK